MRFRNLNPKGSNVYLINAAIGRHGIEHIINILLVSKSELAEDEIAALLAFSQGGHNIEKSATNEGRRWFLTRSGNFITLLGHKLLEEEEFSILCDYIPFYDYNKLKDMADYPVRPQHFHPHNDLPSRAYLKATQSIGREASAALAVAAIKKCNGVVDNVVTLNSWVHRNRSS